MCSVIPVRVVFSPRLPAFAFPRVFKSTDVCTRRASRGAAPAYKHPQNIAGHDVPALAMWSHAEKWLCPPCQPALSPLCPSCGDLEQGFHVEIDDFGDCVSSLSVVTIGWQCPCLQLGAPLHQQGAKAHPHCYPCLSSGVNVASVSKKSGFNLLHLYICTIFSSGEKYICFFTFLTRITVSEIVKHDRN